ncbi:hypothetical protein FHX74_000231 [Friedmanniella endophytica]|uniref:Phytanoyl-CoA dioxygenase (PhyH) n=1 Tax=Microlunatus kandeliicorticis TaxID=1759536 RepID=A0A7W3IP49_9ACTN|nr:hypothetical protein [Microlunatus kandeliicorticis]MBA8792637.1 hypothetical protein [Microlunatus kandeliicorticis]
MTTTHSTNGGSPAVSTPGRLEQAVGTARRGARVGLRAVRSQRHVARYLFNAGPVRRYNRRPAVLTPEAARVHRTLAHDGIAITNVIDLLGDSALFEDLRAETAELRARPDLPRDPAKPFLTELLGDRPAVRPSDALLRFARHSQVRGIAEAYSGMELQIQDVNIWVNTPVDGGPTQSQRWHRDLPEDHDIVKCFVYLSDVPDGAGPLSYVTGSNTRAGRKQKLPAEFDGIGYRLSDDDVAAHFGADRITVGRGDLGTVVFADTRGIHKGGFATTQERVLAQITYASRASSRPRTLRPAVEAERDQLTDLRLAG